MAGKVERILQELLGQGKQESAVAAYGTSVETLEVALKSGYVPSVAKEKVPGYAKKVMDGEEFLYFATPYTQALEGILPEIGGAIRNSLKIFSPQRLAEELSDDNVFSYSRNYATAHALTDSFYAQTGIFKYCSDILMAASEIVPEHLEEQFHNDIFLDSHTSLEAIAELSEPDDVQDILRSADKETLKKVLPVCLERRGVILYFNDSLLKDDRRVFPGNESELEIFVVSPSPLPVAAITGIEMLSDVDLEALRKLLK